MSDTQPEQKVCPTCSGQGKIIFNRSREGKPNTYETCPTCNGTSTAPVERGYEETPPTGMTTDKVGKEEQWCQDHKNCDYRPKSDKQPEEKVCHCGKEGHAINSVNCPVHGTGKVAKDTEKDFGNPKGQTFEGTMRQVVYKLGHEIVELAVAASYEQGLAISVNHEAVNTHANIILAAHNADKQATEKKAWAEGYHKGAEFSQQAAVRAVLEGLLRNVWNTTYEHVDVIDAKLVKTALAALDQPTGGEK